MRIFGDVRGRDRGVLGLYVEKHRKKWGTELENIDQSQNYKRSSGLHAGIRLCWSPLLSRDRLMPRGPQVP